MDEPTREKVAAWCRANNINPNYVPANYPSDIPRIKGDTIHYLSVIDENGAKARPDDPDYVPLAKLDGSEVAREEKSTPLLVPPTGVVKAFLESAPA